MNAKTKLQEGEFVIATQSFAADDLPPPGVIKRKTRLHRDNPIALAHPHYFVSADTPDDEIPNEHHYLAEHEEHESDVRILERLPDEQLVEAICDLSIGFGGEVIRKGTLLPATDWRARSGGDWFRPVIPAEEERDGS